MFKGLVSTTRKLFEQYRDPGDVDFYNMHRSGEPLYLGWVCDKVAVKFIRHHTKTASTPSMILRPVTTCGCERGFAGFSGGNTTIGMVMNLDEQLTRELFHLSPSIQSWVGAGISEQESWETNVMFLYRQLKNYEVGTLLMTHTLGDEFILFQV